MTIDLESERLNLNQAAQLLEVNLSTIWRWCLRGVRGRKLPSFVIGGRRFVYREELEDFLAAQNGQEDSPVSAKPSRKAKRRAEAAGAKLDRLGIGT